MALPAHGAGASMSSSSDVAALQAEVERLQAKLHALHATDVSTLRRGYATVAQHVDALKHEASRLEQLVDELEPQLYSPEFVAEEFAKAGAVGGAVYGIFQLVKTITPLPAKTTSWLRRGLVAVTAIVISWRFAASSIGRFAASLLDHKRRRKALLQELAALQQRIDTLHALTSSMPGALAAAAPQQQQTTQQQQAAASTAAAAGAGAAAREAAAGAGAAPGAAPPERFVLVELPRVESGGFVLTSPIASPAPDAVLANQLTGGALSSVAPGLEQQQQQQQQERGGSAATAAAVRQQLPAAMQSQLLHHQQQPGVAAGQQQPLAGRRGAVQPGVATGAGPSAFTAPASVLGWGGVALHQQRSLQQWQLQAAGGTAAPTAVGRLASGCSEEGEWIVEQPGASSADELLSTSNNGASSFDGAGGRAAAAADGSEQQQRRSPALSSASDDAVLLERE